MSPLIVRGQVSRGTHFYSKILITLEFWSGIQVPDASQELMSHAMETTALQNNHLKLCRFCHAEPQLDYCQRTLDIISISVKTTYKRN